MGQQNWEIVLSYLYNTEGEIFYRKEKNSPEKLDIVQETSLSPIELENTLEHMDNIGLVDHDVVSYEVVTGYPEEITREFNKYSLSSKGFEVAHDREVTKSQQKTNRKSARLSAYLVIGIVLQSLVAILQYDANWQTATVSAIILLLVFLVLSEIYRESIEERLNKHGVLDRIPEL